MPHPGDLDHTAWSILPSFLKSRVRARFDQMTCNNVHGFPARAMCTGLSLEWLETASGFEASAAGAAERLTALASFDHVVHARTIHNLYRMEHKFGIDQGMAVRDADALMQAGISSVVQAAETKGMRLQPLTGQGGLPYVELEHAMEPLAAAERGLVVLFSPESAHALAFQSAQDDRKIIFDPNFGEFEVAERDLPRLIEELAAMSNLPLEGINVLQTG